MADNPQEFIQIKHNVRLDQGAQTQSYAAKRLPSARLHAEAMKSGKSADPASPNTPPLYGEPTLEQPAIRPDEIVPTELTIFCGYGNDFPLEEVQFRYGAAGMLAATFALRMDGSGPAKLIAHPFEMNEREIFPDTHEYHIRLGQLNELIDDCLKNGFLYNGAAVKLADEHSSASLEYVGLDEAMLAFDVEDIMRSLQTQIGRGFNPDLGLGLGR